MSDLPETYTLDPAFEKLLSIYEKEQKKTTSQAQVETIKVNFVVSAAASIYEVIRNAVEYREQHLLQRAAIERILKRLIYLQDDYNEAAENLIRELIWARYLPNDAIPETKIREISTVIERYLKLWKEYNKIIKVPEGKRHTFEFLLMIASCEIEEQLFPTQKREAFYEFANHFLKNKITFDPAPFAPAEKPLLIRTALRKALLKSDKALLSFDLFTQYFPEWKKSNPDYHTISKNLLMARRKIREIIDSKVTEKIFYYFRDLVAPFLILQDALEKNPDNVRQKTKASAFFMQMIEKTTQERYHRIRTKLTVAATRSIIYIFLTKMIIAFLLEFPYEKFIAKEINLVPLAINLLVPPSIMFLVTLTIKVPGNKNTEAIKQFVKSLVYKEIPEEIPVYRERRPLSKGKKTIFAIFYGFGFMVTFGLIGYFLIKMHFSIISGFIFVMFLTLVTFFGFMIRQQVRDIKFKKEHQSPLATLIDFFAFPIIETGSLLSSEISKINITVFVFDLFFEAPFKTIILLFEEWFSFVRDRKEEIV